MMQARLSASLWVEALIRRANVMGASAFVLQRGDAERGDVVVKVSSLDGLARAYRPSINMEGDRIFLDLAMQGVGPEEGAIDAYISRERMRDTDLWVIEIEDREGRHFITEPVENS